MLISKIKSKSKDNKGKGDSRIYLVVKRINFLNGCLPSPKLSQIMIKNIDKNYWIKNMKSFLDIITYNESYIQILICLLFYDSHILCFYYF